MARRRKQESAWPAVLAFGALAGVIGAVVYANRAQAAPAAPPAQPPQLPPAASPPVTPPVSAPSAYTDIVTDPLQVSEIQNYVAGSLSAVPNDLGISLANYGPSDVDGNPSNPRWMHVLSTAQQGINAVLPAVALTGKLPAGYPTQLRTDGVLDQATATAIAHL